MKRSLFLLSVLALTACGGASQTTETTSTEATTSGGAGGEQVAWADMSFEQKRDYMRDVVMPRMQTVFQDYDSERFSSFTCATCHGSDAFSVNFRMPNGLAPLDPQNIPALFENEETRPMAEFMAGPVEHTMAELLGEQPYDPETQQGFGCLNCHATAGAE